jgi:hypothetical protein
MDIEQYKTLKYPRLEENSPLAQMNRRISKEKEMSLELSCAIPNSESPRDIHNLILMHKTREKNQETLLKKKKPIQKRV